MRVQTSRKQNGNLFAEMAVCLFVLVLFLFFPLINMIAVATVYCSAMVLVDQQAHEASLLHHEIADDRDGPVRRDIPREWRRSGIGQFAKTVGRIDTRILYGGGVRDQYGFDYKEITVITRMDVSPFLQCPFPVQVVGINAPVPLTLTSRRLIEDPTNAPS